MNNGIKIIAFRNETHKIVMRSLCKNCKKIFTQKKSKFSTNSIKLILQRKFMNKFNNLP
jgi:hypothetical protein